MPKNILYPIPEYQNLNKKCQILVEDSVNNSEKQFIVGKSLIEGENDFPINIKLGLQYLEHSIKANHIESIIYYIRLLNKGDIISQDLEKANEYLLKISPTNDSCIFVLKGEIYQKNNQYSEALKSFKEGSDIGNVESMYKYGKMLFLGEGIKKNTTEALKYFRNSSDKGYKKSETFIKVFEQMSKFKEFLELSAEAQFFLIKNNISYNYKKQTYSEFNQIMIDHKKTETLFNNKSLKSNSFQKCLKRYKNITIEVGYPSKAFKSILSFATKIRKKNSQNVQIGIVFSSSPDKKVFKTCFSKDISFHKIDTLVRTISANFFNGCVLLKSIFVPSSVIEINYNAFKLCSSLTQIIIPSSVTKIGWSAFEGCSSLTQIVIPSSVTEIEESAFKECTSLAQIIIPSSVTKIEKSAFEGCSSLTQMTIPPSLTVIEEYTFKKCSSLKQISIPSSVTEFGYASFSYCEKLRDIIIPSSVAIIGKECFYRCILNSDLFEFPSSLRIIEGDTFHDCRMMEITIPSSVTQIGKFSFADCIFLQKVLFQTPSRITSIGHAAFMRYSSLQQISIPYPVAEISTLAFSDCTSLTSISFPSSLKRIGEAVFYDCKSLEQAYVPSSLNFIGQNTFPRNTKMIKT